MEQAIVDYIDYYNNKRIKVKLKGLGLCNTELNPSLKLFVCFCGRTNSAFLLKSAKNLNFLFADNIRSFIFGMIESMPRSRPVNATYQITQALCHHFLENTWNNSTQRLECRRSDN